MTSHSRRSAPALLVLLLNLAWYVAASALVLTIGLAVLSPFIDFSGARLGVAVSFVVDAPALDVRAPAVGEGGAIIENATGTLIFTPSRKAVLAAPALAVILLLGLALWIVGELRAFVRTVRDGQPFLPANVRRLQRLGWLLLLVEPLRAAMVFSATRFAAAAFVANGLRFGTRIHVDGVALAGGLIVLALAEAFRIATRLDEDQSLTI